MEDLFVLYCFFFSIRVFPNVRGLQRKTLLQLYGFFCFIEVFRFQPKTIIFFSVSSSLLVLSSFVSNRWPYCFRSVSFSLLLFFLQNLCTQFLKNGSADFYETFRFKRCWSEFNVHFYFEDVGLSRNLLMNSKKIELKLSRIVDKRL